MTDRIKFARNEAQWVAELPGGSLVFTSRYGGATFFTLRNEPGTMPIVVDDFFRSPSTTWNHWQGQVAERFGNAADKAAHAPIVGITSAE